MQCLIDGDILRYEIGFSGQYKDEDGELIIREFDFVKELFDQKIKEICAECWATEPPLLFLTYDKAIHKIVNRRKKLKKEEVKSSYAPNFRDNVAKKKVYKGARKASKPSHFLNLTAYILNNYNCVFTEGLEADDLMCIEQMKRIKEKDTIICTRDKDLRMCPGLHFGWQCGKQHQFGPKMVDELGEIELVGNNKLIGTGLKFFYSQLITGDSVDSIPGLPKGGPVLAFNTLNDCTTEEEMFNAVLNLYKERCGDTYREEMLEQAHLLWMIRELEKDGSPVMWQMYDNRG